MVLFWKILCPVMNQGSVTEREGQYKTLRNDQCLLQEWRHIQQDIPDTSSRKGLHESQS